MVNLKSNKDILNTIPHGSGINSGWCIERKHNKVYLSNMFHTMDEYGFYDAMVPFKLVVPIAKPDEFKLHFATDMHYYANKYMLREYLEDTFAIWVNS